MLLHTVLLRPRAATTRAAEARDAYLVHPAHGPVSERIQALTDDVLVVDLAG